MRKMVAVVIAGTVAGAGFGSPAAAAPGDAQASGKKKCHKSYRGRCLRPGASDYDCAGGSGNGPYYTGRVRVVGPDVFRLDADRDGIGCE